MSFQDLGSLGELLAAIATLVTLIYLASQMVQVMGWFMSQLNGYENLYTQMEESERNDSKLDMRFLITQQLEPEWATNLWTENQGYFTTDFRTFVNDCIGSYD
jgi:hypothetical protein